MLIHSLNRLEKPSSLPISLAEAKLYLKVDHDLEDQLIEDMIKASTHSFEDATSIALIPQIWQVIYKDIDTNIIELPIKPITKIISISTIHFDNRITSINNFRALTNSILFNSIPDGQLVIIEFRAGPNQKDIFIPANIKLALLEHIAFLYDNRGITKQFDLNIYNKFRTIQY